MSHKKALLASSLTVCSASTSFAVGSNDGSVAYAEDPLQHTQSHHQAKTDFSQSRHQYLKSVSISAADPSFHQTPKTITYNVEKGDTLYRIGLLFGIHYQDLAQFNQITNPRKLKIGQQLQIPLQAEWAYTEKRETVESLAKKYHTTIEVMTYLNPIFQEQRITERGQWILVPKKVRFSYRKPLDRPAKQKVKKSKKVVKFTNPTLENSTPKQATHRFLWPVKGQITSKFGWRHGRQHKGIDIWNAARSKALIYASQDGVVTRAGYTGGYGNLVVIEHGNGWVTYYAHLSKIGVAKGQRLKAGDIVGNMGKTGNATGYHLHFEIRKNGEAMNPLSLLP